jgi:hypothetical protein
MQITEYLTVTEYAKRAKVAKSTVFKWMREGKTLREGIHYVHLGRALRFPYPQCLQAPLHEASVVKPREGENRQDGPARHRAVSSRRRARCASRVNLDFGDG